MIGHDIPLPILLTGLAIAGAYVGRFLNRCSRRFPEHDFLRDQLVSLTTPDQICRGCDSRPTRRESVPILGWLLSGRR